MIVINELFRIYYIGLKLHNQVIGICLYKKKNIMYVTKTFMTTGINIIRAKHTEQLLLSINLL